MTESTDLDDASLDEAPEIDPNQIRMAIEELHSHQNLFGGAIAGFAAACIGAALWAVVTIGAGLQIGWFAIGIGFLVGFAVRTVGKGLEPVFGYVGGTLSLVGCLAGNLFALVGLIANSKGVPFLEELNGMNPTEVIDLMVVTFSPIDLLFYGIAVYEGYRLSFRQLTERDADELMAKQV